MVQSQTFAFPQNYEEALTRAAESCRVDGCYWDVSHRQHCISQEGLRLILESLGWDLSSQESIQNQLLSRFERGLRAPAKKSCVISFDEKAIELTLAADQFGTLALDLELEDGGHLQQSIGTSDLVVNAEFEALGETIRVYRLPLPEETPFGYHYLNLTLNGDPLARVHVAVCPNQCYLPPELEDGGKTAGFNVTLYGLRSNRNWGCGDFTDLKTLLDWTHTQGFSFVGLNPLHALLNRIPYNTSPYLPLCIFYKNHIYLDVEAAPEFAQSRWAQALRQSPKINARIEAARDSEFVAYNEVDLLKLRFLKLIYREFRRGTDAARRQCFDEFCRQEGALLNKFALYRALDEILHKKDRDRWTWQHWPKEYHDPESKACREFALAYPRTLEFYKFVQFLIEEQLQQAQTHARQIGMSIGLYHDLAVATDRSGADLWAHGDFYVDGCRVGSPPDDFSPKGQDWSFPPPNSEAHEADGYQLYRESIRKIVRNGGALRLDHVMRLYRLFWIPAGMEPLQGTYVRDQAIDLMRILALESVRSRNIVIGEDLGTVTDEIRDLLARFRVLSYRLFYFEKNRDGYFNHSGEYPRQALVSSTTHDLATLAGFWQYRDSEARRSAGMTDESGYWDQRRHRDLEKQRMLDTLHSEGFLPQHFERNAAQLADLNGDLHNAAIRFLAQTPSMLLLINQEDLTKETEQQNLPGTTDQYPNWRRKMRFSIDQLSGSEVAPYAAMIRNQLILSGRAAH